MRTKDRWNHLRDFAFNQLNVPFERCLEPNWQCERRAVRAHSIQNARVLEQLAVDGHVVMLSNTLGAGMLRIDFTHVGRNRATTFTGLCDKHDHEIFKPIDTSDIDLSDQEHLFLLAYRSIIRELHTTMEGARRVQTVYRWRVDQGFSPKEAPDNVGLFAIERLTAAYDTYIYKRKYDEAFLGSSHDTIYHEVVNLGRGKPTIAVSALSSDETVRTPNDVARVAINVFPQGGEVYAVFSCLASEQPCARALFANVVSAAGEYQKYALSKLVLRCCENFVISPAHFQTLDVGTRECIRQYFSKTIFENDPGTEDPRLYLF